MSGTADTLALKGASDLHQAGNDGRWLVATLDGVSTSSLHYSGDLVT
jgi:hypothetical protein